LGRIDLRLRWLSLGRQSLGLSLLDLHLELYYLHLDWQNLGRQIPGLCLLNLDLRLGRTLEEKLLCTNAARLLGLDLQSVKTGL